MTASTALSADIPIELDGKRLDQALAVLFQDYSRSRLQQWIREGQVQVDGRVIRPKDKVFAGEHVTVQASLEAEGDWEAQAIPLDIVYEDDNLLVINKPAGLVVHPAAGNYSGTMLNALLHHVPQLEQLPRAGIIHRLDKETSGLLVVAKDLRTHKELVAQLQAREFEREYLAVVISVMTAGGTVDAPIGRHPVQRKRMAVVEGGKPAITHYRVEERYRAHSLIRVRLETGRTHQIRVHMAYVHYPIVGDPVYGGRLKLPRGCTPALAEALQGFRRQALHAARLGVVHPHTGEFLAWEAPLPADMEQLLAMLRADAMEVGRD
ncbi:MAG: 23S rRNA pseudouridine(1911/1915/1917) synthase RluD [Gammaproteobacteria bacterium]|nr:23S rRNA pseudouridine(1911/1915/1917) synthase RluD [Gammaproteobacteria bacterium]